MSVLTRVCKTCGVEKPHSDYYTGKLSCKSCMRQNSRLWRERNVEAVIAYRRSHTAEARAYRNSRRVEAKLRKNAHKGVNAGSASSLDSLYFAIKKQKYLKSLRLRPELSPPECLDHIGVTEVEFAQLKARFPACPRPNAAGLVDRVEMEIWIENIRLQELLLENFGEILEFIPLSVCADRLQVSTSTAAELVAQYRDRIRKFRHRGISIFCWRDFESAHRRHRVIIGLRIKIKKFNIDMAELV